MERNACGDLQGMHKNIWNLVKGFVESEHVFHIDTMLALDVSAFQANIIMRQFSENIHISHGRQSKKTAHFKFFNQSIKNIIRHAIPSAQTSNFSRPNWGFGSSEFTIVYK